MKKFIFVYVASLVVANLNGYAGEVTIIANSAYRILGNSGGCDVVDFGSDTMAVRECDYARWSSGEECQCHSNDTILLFQKNYENKYLVNVSLLPDHSCKNLEITPLNDGSYLWINPCVKKVYKMVKIPITVNCYYCNSN